MSWRANILNFWLGLTEKPTLARAKDPLALRARFERQARMFIAPPFAHYQPDMLDGVPALWANSRPTGEGIILYFHGGGYFMGSPNTHKAMLAHLSAKTGLRTCLPDYRMAPEHQFPAALDDAYAAWQELLRRGYVADNIVLGGDSAGGGLMLALLARLIAEGGPLPAGAFALSPLTDLTLGGASLLENARSERILAVERLPESCAAYAGDTPPDNPGISPLFADFTGAPPIMVQYAETEILRDDSTRLVEKLRAQGVDVTDDKWGHLPHDWPLFWGFIPEADQALDRLADFTRQRVPLTPPDEN